MNSIVKCIETEFMNLVPTYHSNGELICSGCGEINPVSHIFYKFIGAYCPIHNCIHYRWANEDWKSLNPSILRKRVDTDPLVLPVKTEHGVDKHFLQKLIWNNYEDTCLAPDFTEVIWNGFENNKDILSRPTDSGYKIINHHGMHAPFLAAIIEWLLYRDEWTNLTEIIEKSDLTEREKIILLQCINSPTPSRIFKMLWAFNRFIPGWHYKRTLGRRSPSRLIQDEIRWACNRYDNLNREDLARLERCGPERALLGSWLDLWPENIPLSHNLNEFGPELARLGIRYGDNTLSLIIDPNRQIGERSWQDIIIKLIHWPVEMAIGGTVLKTDTIIKKNGFVYRLISHLKASSNIKIDLSRNKWKKYLDANLPLYWECNKIVDREKQILHYYIQTKYLNYELLQTTLLVCKPWIKGETKQKVILNIIGQIEDEVSMLLNSISNRFYKTSVEIVTSQNKAEIQKK